MTKATAFSGMVSGTAEALNIAQGAIGTEQLADGSITAAKLDTRYWPMEAVAGKDGKAYLGTADNAPLALGVGGKEIVVVAGSDDGAVITVQGSDLGVDGTVAATKFVGDGSGLTNLGLPENILSAETAFDGDVSGDAGNLVIKAGA